MRALTFSSLALVALASLSGCGDDSGTGCTTGSECPSGICTDGRCQPAVDGGGVDGGCDPASCDDGNACNGVETCGASGCVAGTPEPDGTACDADGEPTTTDFCVDGTCAPSRCGDGVVDMDASEECDDANDVMGDGCDDCRFSCNMDEDCDDGEECSGVESCDMETHACIPGTPLRDETGCAMDTGTCLSGVCRPRLCMEDAECSDRNACNGLERCVMEACMTADPLDCDDMNECTADSCVPDSAEGCLNVLIDEDGDMHSPDSIMGCGDDCDDTDPTVYMGAPEPCDGKDNDCDGMIDEGGGVDWYPDCDRDGYAVMGATPTRSCAMPPLRRCLFALGGWTTRAPTTRASADCNDLNSTVNPAQTVYQSTAIAGADASVDFDYNCNTIEETELPTTSVSCRSIGLSCIPDPPVPGWFGRAPPCGGTGSWLTGCTGTFTCTPRTVSRVQRCR